MSEFAKLYNTDLGQILVVFDSNEKGEPCIIIHFKPKGLGLCKLQLSYTDSDTGWDEAENAFNAVNHITEDSYYQAVKSALEDLGLSE